MENKAASQSNAGELGAQERDQLDQISGGESVHGQRAQALLALDQGATLADAAQESGLTVSAVRYWKAKFQQQGIGIFPEELLFAPSPTGEAETEEPVPAAKKKKGGKKKSGKKARPKKMGKKKSKKKKNKGKTKKAKKKK